jgi:hypothetical protein
MIFPASKNQGKLPLFLSLPFLFHISIKDIKQEYDIELLAHKDYHVITFTHKNKSDIGPSRIVIFLNNKSLLPVKVCSSDVSQHNFDRPFIIEHIEINNLRDNDLLRFQERDDWSIKRSPVPFSEYIKNPFKCKFF